MQRKRKASNSAGISASEQARYGDFANDSSFETANLPGRDEDAHYQQLYAKRPDFIELARLDPEFAAVVKRRDLDFNDPASVTQLTKTLLKLDFGLTIDLPSDRLCPPVANRHNYILWLKSLLDTSSYEKPGRKAIGLDIGTGASCIYPLLGCTQRPWSFIATDIDERSLDYARRNIKANNLEHRINILLRKPDESMLPLDELDITSIDFTMTNPPFYASTDELLQSAAQKSQPPHSACTGTDTEMVTLGGEVAFILRIFAESLRLRERVQWYTAMCGFHHSVSQIVLRLRQEGVENYAVTEFIQGSKTRRWAVAWSFGAMRPADGVARGMKASISKSLLPPTTKATIIQLPFKGMVGDVADRLATAIGQLDLLSWSWDAVKLEGVGRAPDIVWNRAWRRKKKREMDNDEQTNQASGRDVFGFRVSLHVGREHIDVTSDWLEGHNSVVFESFQGYLKATMTS